MSIERYGAEGGVGSGGQAILTNARYFPSYNKVLKEGLGGHLPARICSVQDLVVECKVEVGVTRYRA